MFDTRPVGKYRARRFAVENTADLLPQLPRDLQGIIRNELDKAGLSYWTRKQLPVRSEGATNAVKMEMFLVEGNPNLEQKTERIYE